MLSITVKKGQTAKDLAGVADYPDENRNKEKQVGAVEDYYSQGSEATPSRWLGGAAAELGLSGAVNRDHLLATLQGFDPRTGEALVQKAGVDRRYAFDLTFSAPKSVSIAWAVGTEEVKRGIEDAQDRAVERTLAFIEEKFALARRGSSKEGTITKEHVKLLSAVYRHGSSRELDPQIHSHAMLQNMGLRADGTWGALNEKELFEWKLALGAVYRAELSSEISKNLGFGIEADREYFRLPGIPKELEEEFSKRRVQIEKALKEKGLSGGKAAEVAALDTRKGKEVVEAEILSEEWKKIAGEYGITAESLQGLRGMERESNHDSFSLDRPELLRKLTTMEAVFQEKDLFRVAGVACSQNGRGLDDVKAEVAACLKDPEIVKLRGKDGEIYYTTQEMLALEQEIQSMARAGKEDARHVVFPEATKAGIARYEFEKGFKLSDEQHNAIEHLTTQAGRIRILEGHAGAGKSTALVPVRYALEASGFEVIGASLQGKKAAGLQKDTGIRSQTLASLLRELQGYEREDGEKVPPTRILSEKTVVVVDEAAMNDTRLMAGLIRETEKAGAKLILVGDESQVPPVAAGNPFKTLKKELGYAELTENRRQRSDWQKDASREIRSGQVKEGLQKYLEANMISIAQDRDEAIKKTVEAWSDHFVTSEPTKTLLTAYRREDVRELNDRARAEMKTFGSLTGPRVETTVRDREGNSEGKREFQAGERLYFKKNDRKLGVMNGETGTLANIDVTSDGKDCVFTVKMDNGKEIRFDPRDYAQIDYGYAVTIHKSQGETVDFSSNLVTGMGLNALYVQLTRHRDGTQIVLTEDQIDKMAQNSGVELEPTDRMIDFTEQLLAKQQKLAPLLPEDWNKNFDVLRKFLDKYSGVELGGRKEREGQNEFDPRLEKVKALLASIRKNEKMNALDFEIVDVKEKMEGKLENWIGKEVLEKPEDRSMGAPSPEKEPGNGKEEGIRPAEREYELERGGMEM
jgi:Ti-type conjugative transfer relaxase TraA|uniref:Conjugal transfer protein, TraA n=2 Tax=Leptospirillum TaxID=179 RepID=B6ASB0_9BACT|nr:MAG: Conjugal transfer protein, TraA [Leptospirillum sp. Group II '5-way CG']EES53692.1 MAG: putative conjugal transfer protein (TraA) [Leptospirillum ferrodiazotrophum]